MPAIVDTPGIARRAAQYELPLPESKGSLRMVCLEMTTTSPDAFVRTACFASIAALFPTKESL
ncbi:hypothetical protein [Thiobacillus sp.]|uniref:hypothetical protein n=1 Tax=Thiobacillus sp. TaxID=924 RepID=UPI0017FBEC71|nr:hypothetical protein [Thiobacillus sp.]MBC2731896.1 hypothetical protein [Thiobacillus sp.]MBC2740634.1 hypothetical protein [Thiobacillus sp.]MBC2758513.1 hypothetical protein [Thiobacillus sp.]MBD3812406.1 hypothetical protein [Betaproteobacteria bacterium]